MADILDSFNATWFWPALLLVLLVAWLIYRRRAGGDHLHRVLKDCASRLKDGRPIGATLALGRKVIERAGFGGADQVRGPRSGKDVVRSGEVGR